MRKQLLVVLAGVMGVAMYTGVSQAAYHLERADGSRPNPGIGFYQPTQYTWTPHTLPNPAPPKPKPQVAPQPRPVTEVTGTRNSDSSNHRVDPWGCEAEHAQEWNPSGKYWGKYQFDRQTWAAHGGDPAEYGSAPESEQDRVAAQVKYDAWPNC